MSTPGTFVWIGLKGPRTVSGAPGFRSQVSMLARSADENRRMQLMSFLSAALQPIEVGQRQTDGAGGGGARHAGNRDG